jgi:hypothetical protein
MITKVMNKVITLHENIIITNLKVHIEDLTFEKI